MIYITYYRFLWSQLGNLPGHCSLFPATSTLHKEESFQANPVPSAGLFLLRHPSSLPPSWAVTKGFSLLQILTMLRFLFGLHSARSETRWVLGWLVPTWNFIRPALAYPPGICTNVFGNGNSLARQKRCIFHPNGVTHQQVCFPSKSCCWQQLIMIQNKAPAFQINHPHRYQSSSWTLPTMWFVVMIND